KAYSQTMKVSASGLYALGMDTGKDSVVCEPAVCLLKLPHKDGARWEVASTRTFKSGFSVKDSSKFTAYGPEEVKVPAGTFKAIRVVSIPADGTGWPSTVWYAPGVGVVRSTSEVRLGGERPKSVESVLKSFTPAKD